MSALYVSLVKTTLLIVPLPLQGSPNTNMQFSARQLTFRSKPASPENQTELSFFFFPSSSFLLLCQSIFCVECCDITCGRDQLNFNRFSSRYDGQLRIFRSNKRLLSVNNAWETSWTSRHLWPWQLGDGDDDDDDEAEVKCDPPHPDRPHPCHMYDYKWRFPLHVYQEKPDPWLCCCLLFVPLTPQWWQHWVYSFKWAFAHSLHHNCISAGWVA